MHNNSIRPHKKIYKINMMDISIFNLISFYNLVMFYKDELLRLMDNKIAKDIFNEAEQNHLMSKLIYIPCHYKLKNNLSYTCSFPSCLTRMILSGFIKIDVKELLKELDNMCIIDNKLHVCKSDISMCFHCYLTGSLCELYYRKGGSIIR